MDLQQLANDILKKAVSRSKGEAEVFIISSRSTKIDSLGVKVEAVDELSETGIALRFVKDKRLGFSYTSDTENFSVEECISQATANAESAAEDEFNCFPPAYKTVDEFSNFDPILAATPLEKKIDLALRLEESAYRYDSKIKKTQKVTYSDNIYEICVNNSNGLSVHYKGNYCGLYAEVISQSNGQMESGFGMDYAVSYNELDPVKTGEEAARKAVEHLGAKSITTQKIDLIIDPYVGSQLLEILANSLSAESVQKGKSLFAGKSGKKIANDKLSIIDNGRLKNGVASAPYDAEGVTTQETILIENGSLRHLLHNTYSAAKSGTRSTGNAARPSFKSFPLIAHSNIYIAAGSIEAGTMIKSLDRGLYISRVMGLHTANPITGDFSFGADGILIEKGERTFPVRGITIAGNLIDILMNIEAIGSDLRFFSSSGSPTLLIPKISVSGT